MGVREGLAMGGIENWQFFGFSNSLDDTTTHNDGHKTKKETSE